MTNTNAKVGGITRVKSKPARLTNEQRMTLRDTLYRAEMGLEYPGLESCITISFSYSDRRNGVVYETDYTMSAVEKHCYENADGLYHPCDPRKSCYWNFGDADDELSDELYQNYFNPLQHELNRLGYDIVYVYGFSFSLM